MKSEWIKFFSAALFPMLALSLSGAVHANGWDHDWGNNSRASIITLPVEGVQEGGDWAGHARLKASQNGVRITANSKELGAGVAYTVWIAIFNNPHECATNPCQESDFFNGAVEGALQHLTGRVANEWGRANFEAFLPVGQMPTNPASGNIRHFFGPGLTNPKGAEIHLIVRCHGPYNLNPEQLSTFNGSCDTENCFDVQVAVFPRPWHRQKYRWMDD